MQLYVISPSFCSLLSSTSFNNTCVKFDDLAAVPDGLTTVPGQGGIPVPYKELSWEAFGVATSTPVLGSLGFHSPPQCAITSAKMQLTSGKSPAITTTYPSSKVQSFDLNALYIGCTVNTMGNLNLPTSCTAQVTGYRLNPANPSICDTVGPETVTFNPPTVAGTGGLTLETKANMTQHKFPLTFHTLKNVTIELVSVATTPELATLFFDDVTYTTHSICCP